MVLFLQWAFILRKIICKKSRGSYSCMLFIFALLQMELNFSQLKYIVGTF